MWNLGKHKLLIGDATSASDVAKLVANGGADLVFVDPPCNVDYVGYTEERLKIQGDCMSDAQFKQFLWGFGRLGCSRFAAGLFA